MAGVAAIIGAALGAWALPRARELRGERCLASACAAGALEACAGYVTRFPAGRDSDAVDDGYFRLAVARLPDLDAYLLALPHGCHAGEIVPGRRAMFAEALGAPRGGPASGARGSPERARGRADERCRRSTCASRTRSSGGSCPAASSSASRSERGQRPGPSRS